VAIAARSDPLCDPDGALELGAIRSTQVAPQRLDTARAPRSECDQGSQRNGCEFRKGEELR
jgi:hypothetical protein